MAEKSRTWNKVAVVGGGNMGSGIAQKIASEGVPVTLVDLDDEKVANGLERIRTTLQEGVERRIFRPDQVEAILARVSGTSDLSDLADADLVIEAIFEDLDVKKKLFRDLDSKCGESTILATNTSSFYVRDLAEATERPDRVVGLHYFFHPAKNRLVEVIPGEATSADTYARSWALQELIGKTPIRSADAPGFVVNRYFVPWLNEAVRLLDEGAGNIATIDGAAKSAFRIGMGPFELMNVTGVPIAYHAAGTLGRQLGRFYSPADTLKKQVDSKENWNLDGEIDETKFEAIGDRLLSVAIYVASALVSEKVASIEETDIGARVGLRWALGPFELANRIGLEKAQKLTRDLASRYDLPPAALIETQAESGRPFEFELVTLEIEGGVGTITIRRPDAMNALNEEVVRQLAARFTEAEANDEVRGIVLDGAGKAFVAGADIRFFVKNIKAGQVDKIARFTKTGQDLYRQIDQCRKPVIAKLDGLSLGGGSELALTADCIVMTDRGMMGFPETGIGIYPGLGGTQRTRERVGASLTKYLLYTGDMIDGRTAVSMGLADEFVDRAEVDGRVRELALSVGPQSREVKPVPESFQSIAKFFGDNSMETIRKGEADAGGDPRLEKLAKKVSFKAPIALRITEELIEKGEEAGLDAGLALELENLDRIFRSKDALTGLTSLGRGRPEFQDE